MTFMTSDTDWRYRSETPISPLTKSFAQFRYRFSGGVSTPSRIAVFQSVPHSSSPVPSDRHLPVTGGSVEILTKVNVTTLTAAKSSIILINSFQSIKNSLYAIYLLHSHWSTLLTIDQPCPCGCIFCSATFRPSLT